MAEDVSPEEAKRLGLSASTDVSPDEAARIGLTPVQAQPSRMDRIVSFLKREGPEVLQPWKAAADTASFGLLPRALAATDAIGETAQGHGGLVHNYNHALTDRQADSRKTAENYPSASIAGAFVPSPMMGETIAQRVVGSGLMGAAAGNLQAPHDNPGARLAGGLSGFLAGAGLQGVGEAAGPIAGKIGASLTRDAELAAPQAAGLRAGITNQAQAHGMSNEADVRDFGRKLLDKGLVTFGGTPSGVADRAETMAAQNVATKNGLLQQSEATGTPYNYSGAQRQMTREMQGGRPGGLTAEQEQASGKARDFIARMTDQSAKTPGSVIGADRNKSSAYNSMNWNTEAPEAALLHRKAGSGLRQSIEDHVSTTLGPTQGAELRQANADTGLALDAKSIANDYVGRDAGKLPWYVKAGGMAGGAMMGHEFAGPKGALLGAGAGAVGSVLKARGPSALAVGADMAGNAASRIGQTPPNPMSSARSAGALQQWLNHKPDDEKEAEGADYLIKATQ